MPKMELKLTLEQGPKYWKWVRETGVAKFKNWLAVRLTNILRNLCESPAKFHRGL